MDDSKLQAKERLLAALPYFRSSIKNCQKKKKKLQLGILSVEPDGSGNIEMMFDFEEFFTDIETLIDAPKFTGKDEQNVLAVSFLERVKSLWSK